MVGSVTHRSDNLTGFFETKASLTTELQSSNVMTRQVQVRVSPTPSTTAIELT